MRSEGELGRGAFGAVFKMRHRHKDTVMAVKVSAGDICPAVYVKNIA